MVEVVKDSITEQVYNIVKDKIISQEYKLGEQIDTRKIARENNISTMPVRDALKKLSNQGLVINKSRVGFFVKNFNRREIREIMEARKMYELYCLEEHFHSIDKGYIYNIYNKIADKEELSYEEFDEFDNQFHDFFVMASDNRFIIESYNKIKERIILFKHLDKARSSNVNRAHKRVTANKEHKQILQCMLEGDAVKAKKFLREHINNVTNSVMRKM